MQFKNIQTGICALVLILVLFSAGCIFPQSGSPAAQNSSPTQKPTAEVTTAASHPSSAIPAVTGTRDPWAQFVEPNTTAENAAMSLTSEATEAPTPVITETPFIEVTLTEKPTTIPTIATVADTCSNIGGNACLSNETCSGEFIKTTDVAQCCAGICEAR
jgi:hypothetical protein